MSLGDVRQLELIVPAGEPVRLDRFLAVRLAGGSRQHARELIAAGLVRVNGRFAVKSRLLAAGDLIVLMHAEPDDAAGPSPEPDLVVPVLYEDDAIVALDKPAGMPSTALRPSDRGTLANFLTARDPAAVHLGGRPGEAGVAHRLDTGTSGVIIAARTEAALQSLRRQFRDHEIEKVYLAVVSGDIGKAGSVDWPIAHAPRHPQRMTACRTAERAEALKARPATTSYRPLERLRAATLVEVRMQTGVRHQVRVHLAAIGFPLAGDELYGGSHALAASRPLLHASTITFRHPSDEARMTVSAPLPGDLHAALEQLRSTPRR